MFVLASKSPRRIELLKKYLIDDFVNVSLDVDERKFDNEKHSIIEYVTILAIQKMNEAIKKYPREIILTCDTTVYLNGEIINKPTDENDAFLMLKKLSNKTHEVYSSYCIAKEGKILKVGYDVSHVTFNFLDDELIKRYIKNKNPLDKAGAYGIQDSGRDFPIIKSYEGSYFNIMGLPVEKLKEEFIYLDIIESK
ncbi:MAG: Maf family protein [Bacilli bacterium]